MATLTRSMLNDLHKGCASLSILPYTGEVALKGLDFTNADQLFTEQDTFNLSPADASIDSYKIDQNDEEIDTNFEEGEWEISGSVPSTAAELFDYFYEAGEAITTGNEVKGPGGTKYTGKGYKEQKMIHVTVLAESKSKKTAIVIGHVSMALAKPEITSHNKPALAKFKGRVLANGTKDVFAVLKASI